MTRLLRRAAAFGAVVLMVGAACSGDQDGNRPASASTATSPGKETDAEAAGTTNPLPGTGSSTAGAGPQSSDAGGSVSVGADATTSTTTAAPGSTPVALRADLIGEAEVPDPGIAGGTGLATLKITGMQLCYTLNAPIREKPILAHIHKGAAREAGDVVINFEVVFTRTPSAFTADKCLNKDPSLLAGIIANPAGFYVNIHTGEHPRGALRGQLERSS